MNIAIYEKADLPDDVGIRDRVMAISEANDPLDTDHQSHLALHGI